MEDDFNLKLILKTFRYETMIFITVAADITTTKGFYFLDKFVKNIDVIRLKLRFR